MLPPLNAVINFAPFQSVCRYRRGISLEIPAPELASEILAAGSVLKSEERHLCGRFPQQGAKSPDVDFCTHSIHLASIAREIHLGVLHGKYRWKVLHGKYSGKYCTGNSVVFTAVLEESIWESERKSSPAGNFTNNYPPLSLHTDAELLPILRIS